MQGKVGGLAGFPLLPFCNRIAYGRFRWQGRDYQLARNFGDHPHTIHGVGWQSAWTVAAVSNRSATLELRHRPDRHWPFACTAELRLTLAERELHVALRLTNRHNAPAPAGLGLHPFFPRATFHTLQFNAGGVWLSGPELAAGRGRSRRPPRGIIATGNPSMNRRWTIASPAGTAPPCCAGLTSV